MQSLDIINRQNKINIFKIEKDPRVKAECKQKTLRKSLSIDKMNRYEDKINNLIHQVNSIWKKIKNKAESNLIETTLINNNNVFNLQMADYYDNLSSELKIEKDGMSMFPFDDFNEYQVDFMREKLELPLLFKGKVKVEITNNEQYFNSDLYFLSQQGNDIYKESTFEADKFVSTNHFTTAENRKEFTCVEPEMKLLNKRKRSSRSRYKMYSEEYKQFCLQCLNSNPPEKVAKMTGVPIKSLKRWFKVGPVRKKGCGRKVQDEAMENKLINWYREMVKIGKVITPKMIKKKALKLSSDNNKDEKFERIKFIASNGWLEKLKKKYYLKLSRTSKINVNNITS